ncbi:MAG: NAD(P)H-dependent glycerol-3-phosphate dehydrogenase, partial [Clostridiales bacterium]|nr:NAD(P)H-dependent glycerol-3-phosphate dehydrogenase [Candidatus Equinaster intestinalis]
LSNENMRLYTNKDVIGAELGGALKNVIAVCVGFCNGLGLGDNTKAALITRGLAEMARLGAKMGADPLTFAGLTGVGDLVVTCTSLHSRNNRFGTLVGGGMPVKEALEKVGTVEGYFAAETAKKLAEKYNVDMPIIEECYNVLFLNKSPEKVVKELMSRPHKHE